MSNNGFSPPVKLEQHHQTLSASSVALRIQALRNQGLPYTSTNHPKQQYSLEEWLAKLDAAIEDSSAAALARRHSLPASPIANHHKRSFSADSQQQRDHCDSRPNKRARRRNSFVIHRDANGQNVSLLGHSSFQHLIEQEDEEQPVDETGDASE